MRPFLLLTIALTVTGFLTSANANSTAPQERWEGYRRADSAEVQNLNLPFQDFAENAVLEMETVGATKTAGERFEVIDVETVAQETNLSVLTDPNNKIPFQIETCRKQGLRYCPVLSYTNKNTTFFNRGRFVSCRHGFHNWLSLASQLNGNRSVSSISPPVILRNARGEVLYNSGYDRKPQLRFSTINDDSRLNYQTHDVSYPSREVGRAVAHSDYVEMTLGERIVNDYAVTERTAGINNLRAHEETYLLGYAVRTNSFPNGPGDAPGRTLMVSNGRALDPFPAYSMLQISNFGSPGASGGPTLTATGELAGVNCRATSEQNPSDVRTYTLPLGSTLAKSHWRTIEYPTDAQLASLDAAQGSNVSQ